jgi:hypothetical protein
MQLDIAELEKRGKVDLAKLSDDELATLKRIMKKAADEEEPMFSDEYMSDR